MQRFPFNFSAIKPHLDSLRNIAGFHLSNELYLRVLQDEKEA
jgi:hypothetical protein